MRKVFLLLIICPIMFSCKSKHEKVVESINTAYRLIESASEKSDNEFTVPMGFQLGCSELDMIRKCEKLAIETDGHQEDIINSERKHYFVNTNEFGNVNREVGIEYLCYHGDSHKSDSKKDKVCRITFSFDEFGSDSLSNGGWEVLKDVISQRFDSSWEEVEFDLENIENNEEKKMREYFNIPQIQKDYYVLWVKDNVVVQLQNMRLIKTVTLTYYNVPVIGAESIIKNIEIEANINKQDNNNKLPVKNSVWDGSVIQVKNYLKKTLKDPDSYEGVEWSKIIEVNGNYQVRHTFRAKNSFGGYVVETYNFTLDSNGTVIDAIKLE